MLHGQLPDQNIRAVYVYPRDTVSRFGTMADLIADDLAAVDRWWRSHDPARSPRFDLAAFANCTGLDISSHRVNLDGEAVEAAGNGAFEVIVDALWTDESELGWDYQNTLVYYDGPPPRTTPRRCGSAQIGETIQGASWAFVWLRACPAGERAAAAARGILHNLAAVPEGAPSRCPGTHVVCGAPSDVMRLGDAPPLWQAELDASRDDYYDHPGWWFDVRDSLWLRRLDVDAP